MDDDRILERERYQIEQIRQLESEELQVEEVDDESSEDGDTACEENRNFFAWLEEQTAPGEFNYDTSLAALHSYLGDVEDTHNRLSFLDGGAVIVVPLFYLEGVVLFPEATLPLRVIQSNFIAAVEKALQRTNDHYTIGVIRVHRDPHNRRIKFATTGTTAEIRQYRRLEDGSVNVVTRGQQRFRLRRRWMDADGAPCGEIQIIQEDFPLRTPREAVGRLTPLRRLHAWADVPLQTQSSNSSLTKHYEYGNGNDSDVMSEESFESELSFGERRLHQSAIVSIIGEDMIDESTSSDDETLDQGLEVQSGRYHLHDFVGSLHTKRNKKSIDSSQGIGEGSASDMPSCKGNGSRKHAISQMREVPRAFWPNWVYRMYDSYALAQRAADRWKQIVKAPNMDAFVMKPDLLSFHIASKIPVSESTRQELLDIDGISYRLRLEIELLEKFDRIQCKTCLSLIARRSEMLVMSGEGPLGAYVNPHGFVHEIMTLLKANGLAVIGNPEKEYSWFPGYAWSIAECVTCGVQMGWLFTATNKKLKPRSFWGIRCSQVHDDIS
nr:protein cereblon [Ipomoea trifida]